MDEETPRDSVPEPQDPPVFKPLRQPLEPFRWNGKPTKEPELAAVPFAPDSLVARTEAEKAALAKFEEERAQKALEPKREVTPLVERKPRERLTPKDGRGRKIKHGLYSRYLGTPEQVKTYHRAGIGTVEEEIRVAKAKLQWALAMWQKDPDGGVPVDHKFTSSAKDAPAGSRIRYWTDIVGEFMNKISMLEKTQHDITADAPTPTTTTVNVLVGTLSGMSREQQMAYLTDGTIDVKVVK